jgi:hypothetical protein
MASKISDKEWLDLAWKYFQQHAQQRISYFNFFVIFSTILTTGLVTTFQKSYEMPLIAFAIGAIQAFLSFMFLKIDERNKFLTKHAEKTIRTLEANVKNSNEQGTQLFTNEDIETNKKKQENKQRWWLGRFYTHGQSYTIIYMFFFIWGMLEISLPFIPRQAKEESSKMETTVTLKYEKIDSLKSAVQHGDSITQQLFENIKILTKEVEKLEIEYKNKNK